MLLSEVFDQLTYGELAQVNIGGAESMGITKESYPAMIAHVNLGLTSLYKRFLLKEGVMYITRMPHLKTYVLNSRYQEGNRTVREPNQYIQASNPAFMDDILKVERVYDELGVEHGLNDNGDERSITTPTYNSIVIPDCSEVKELKLVYRANHPIIMNEDRDIDPSEYEIELPYSHLEALLLFIASRVYNPISAGNQFHEGNNFAGKYEQACQLLEMQNLRVDKASDNTRFIQNGWV